MRLYHLLLVSTLVVAFLCIAAQARDYSKRSDALTSSVALLDEFGQIAGFQLPLKGRPRQEAAINPLAKRAYSVPYNMAPFQAIAWGIPITVGSTSTPVYVDLDTGSADLLVSGTICQGGTAGGCTSGVPYVMSSGGSYFACASSTNCPGVQGAVTCDTGFATMSGQYCVAKDCYGDGTGALSVVVTDTLGIPGVPSTTSVQYGSIYNPIKSNCLAVKPSFGAGFLSANWTGLFGVSFPGAGVIQSNPLDHLLAANGLPDMFSLCVLQSAAFMSIGADYRCNSQFVFVPISSPSSVLSINLGDVGVNGNSLGLSSSQLNQVNFPTIVDSGTSLIVLNNATSTALWGSLQGICTTNPSLVGICNVTYANSIFVKTFALSGQEALNYPPISFTIPGSSSDYTVTLQSSDWILPFQQIGNTLFYRAGFQLYAGKQTILGDTFMGAVHVVFDKANNQIGFGPLSTCTLSAASSNCNPPTSSSSSNTGSASTLTSPLVEALRLVQN